MTPSLRRSVPLVAAILVLAGRAAAEPHSRTGVFIGFGFGLESVSWRDLDGDRNVEASGVMSLRAGSAVRPDLLVGVECWGWTRDDESATRVRLGAATLAVSYFPGAAGFFMRLGAGLAYGSVENAELDPSRLSDTGIAVLFAPGYEWRITQRFALGAQGDIVYLGLHDGVEDAFGYGVNAQFNWYW